MYRKADQFVTTLTAGKENDFEVEEKDEQVSLTDAGVAKAEEFFGLDNFGDPENMKKASTGL